jgi:HlyD family secretion protein
MDEIDAGRIKAGMEARVTVDAFPDSSFEGEVIRLAPYVLDAEEQSRTIEVEVAIRDSDVARRLMPGTTADVAIILDRKPSALRVPTYAILEGDKVFVAKNEVLEERPVVTGLKNWEFTEVPGGVAAGDAVVITLDREEIRAGAKVTVKLEEPKSGRP